MNKIITRLILAELQDLYKSWLEEKLSNNLLEIIISYQEWCDNYGKDELKQRYSELGKQWPGNDILSDIFSGVDSPDPWIIKYQRKKSLEYSREVKYFPGLKDHEWEWTESIAYKTYTYTRSIDGIYLPSTEKEEEVTTTSSVNFFKVPDGSRYVVEVKTNLPTQLYVQDLDLDAHLAKPEEVFSTAREIGQKLLEENKEEFYKLRVSFSNEIAKSFEWKKT